MIDTQGSRNGQWLTVVEFARMMGRRPVTIHKWLSDGTLLDFGFPIYSVCRGRFNTSYYIYTTLV